MALKVTNWIRVSVLVLFHLTSIGSFGANSVVNINPNIATEEEEGYVEISVFLNVPKIGGTEIGALIDGNNVFLSVTELFGFLKIKAEVTPGFNKIEGFFIEEKANYIIDRVSNTIEYNKKIFPLKPGDLVRSETQLYLRLNYFGDIFGLECSFNFRSLSVTLNTSVELPIIKEMRQEQMRKNVSQISGEIEADSTIGRKHPFFRFGAADWSIASTQEIGGATSSRVGMNIGTALAGGEANVSLSYTPGTAFELREQNYSWRYANNNQKILKQAIVGKLSTNSISTLTSSVLGFQLNNTPTTYRKSYGSYTISDFTEPGWTVELYVNNVLLDYKKADASGFFTFDVPLIYGSTSIRLQYYGPWGEVRSEEKEINVPFNFLPQGTLEYNISGGILEDSTHAKYSRLNMDYGATRFLTMGAGVEYFSLLDNGGFIPFANASVRIGSKLLISAEYSHQVKLKSHLNYRLLSGLQLELDYTIYDKNQTAIRTSYLEERKAAISIPIKLGKATFFTRLSYDNYISKNYSYNAADLMIGGAIGGVSTNLSTKATFSGSQDPDIYSTLNLAFRLPFGFQFTPQAQYNYTRKEMMNAKGRLEKQLGRSGFLTLSYDHNFASNSSSIEAGLRFDLSFAKFGITARRSAGKYTISENASGSIVTDFKGKYIGTSVRGNVGRGGLVFKPFVDINGNGIKDPGEPKAFGMDIQMNGGRVEYSEKDTLTRVSELEPYADYLITLYGSRFDNISWLIQNKTLKVSVDPNQFKHIDIPISVVGEAAGYVYLRSKNSEKGLGRIIVNYYRNGNKKVASVLSEEDGYFTYMGLLPGKYVAMLDKEQLERVGMDSKDYKFEFEVEQDEEGTYIDGIKFIIDKIGGDIDEEEEQATQKAKEAKKVIDTKKIIEIQENEGIKKTQEKSKTIIYSNQADTLYKVQLFASTSNENAYERLLPILIKFQNIEVTETHSKDGYYRYSIGSYTKRTDAAKMLLTLRLAGWNSGIVTSYNPVKEKEITTNTISFVPEKGCFRIQLYAGIKINKIDKEFSLILNEYKKYTITEEYGSDGLYRYSVTPFSTRAQALDAVRQIRSLGWKDAFIKTVTQNQE